MKIYEKIKSFFLWITNARPKKIIPCNHEYFSLGYMAFRCQLCGTITRDENKVKKELGKYTDKVSGILRKNGFKENYIKKYVGNINRGFK